MSEPLHNCLACGRGPFTEGGIRRHRCRPRVTIGECHTPRTHLLNILGAAGVPLLTPLPLPERRSP